VVPTHPICGDGFLPPHRRHRHRLPCTCQQHPLSNTGGGVPSPTPCDGDDYFGKNNTAFSALSGDFPSPTHGGGSPSPITSGGSGFLPHIGDSVIAFPVSSGDVPSPTRGCGIVSPTPNNSVPFGWAPRGARDEPPLDIRWGLLRDAQKIRICMHLSLIWQIFSSKIIFLSICLVINIWIQAILSLALLGLKKISIANQLCICILTFAMFMLRAK
jgi:hypothetical protein